MAVFPPTTPSQLTCLLLRTPQSPGASLASSRAAFATEHGPSGFDGPGGETNSISSNLVKTTAGLLSVMTKPIQTLSHLFLSLLPAEAPSGALIYTGSLFPQFKNNLFSRPYADQAFFMSPRQSRPNKTLSYQKLEIDLGRIRDIIQSQTAKSTSLLVTEMVVASKGQ